MSHSVFEQATTQALLKHHSDQRHHQPRQARTVRNGRKCDDANLYWTRVPATTTLGAQDRAAEGRGPAAAGGRARLPKFPGPRLIHPTPATRGRGYGPPMYPATAPGRNTGLLWRVSQMEALLRRGWFIQFYDLHCTRHGIPTYPYVVLPARPTTYRITVGVAPWCGEGDHITRMLDHHSDAPRLRHARICRRCSGLRRRSPRNRTQPRYSGRPAMPARGPGVEQPSGREVQQQSAATTPDGADRGRPT